MEVLSEQTEVWTFTHLINRLLLLKCFNCLSAYYVQSTIMFPLLSAMICT